MRDYPEGAQLAISLSHNWCSRNSHFLSQPTNILCVLSLCQTLCEALEVRKEEREGSRGTDFSFKHWQHARLSPKLLTASSSALFTEALWGTYQLIRPLFPFLVEMQSLIEGDKESF